MWAHTYYEGRHRPMTNGNGTTEAFQIARPTFVIDGEEHPELAQGLVSLLVAENTAGLYRCEVLFGNWGPVDRRVSFLYFDRRVLEFGKALVIKLGRDTIFEGRITGLEGRFPQGRPPEIVALAEDRFQDLRMTRRTRTFADKSDDDIFRTIADEHELTPSLRLDGPTHKLLAQ